MLGQLWTAWLRLWTKRLAPEPIAAFRIAIGLIVIVDVAYSMLPYVEAWYSSYGTYNAERFATLIPQDWQGLWRSGRWSLLPADFSTTQTTLWLVGVLLLALCVTVGAFTPLTTALCWAGLLSIHNRNPILLNAGDFILRAALFFLIWMHAGRAWSVDNWLRRKLGWPIKRDVPAWGVRLAQLQLVLMYCATALHKLKPVKWSKFINEKDLGDWVEGRAIGYALHHITLARWEWLTYVPWKVFMLATWATLIWELCFPALVLFRATLPGTLAFGYVLHMGIFLTMEVQHFSLTTLAYYWLFVPASVLVAMRGRDVTGQACKPYVVFYDTLCPICRASRRWLMRLDWGKRLSFEDLHQRERAEALAPGVSYADMLRRMYVVRREGEVFGGFQAFRAIAPMLPLCWPIVPLLWLPGMTWLGEHAYVFIAKNRYRYARCDDNVCSMHLHMLAGKSLDEDAIRKLVAMQRQETTADTSESSSD